MKQIYFSSSNFQLNIIRIFGFTIVELMIVLAIVGLLAMIAVPTYQNYVERVDADDTAKDLIAIQFSIDDFELTYGNLPISLTDIGMDNMKDPWGNPYVYANHAAILPGARRKDQALVPINSDYDLYSKGKDGVSSPPLTANPSKDDIVRGRDGGFIGKATEF